MTKNRDGGLEMSTMTVEQECRARQADYTRPIPGAPGFSIRRRLVGYAYPRNGNVHNPTPRYLYELLLDDRIVDCDPRMGPLLRAAKAPGAAKAYGGDACARHETGG